MAINPYDVEGIDPYALDDDVSLSLLPEEQRQKLEGDIGVPVFFGNETSPEQNEFIDNVLAFPRGIGKSAARMVAAEIPEGLWAMADLATNLTGFEDVLDEKESAFLDRLQEVRDKIGYEESVPGKLGEALGSMGAFVGTAYLTGGMGALSKIPQLLKAGKYLQAAKLTPWATAPGMMFAASEQNLRMNAARKAGKDYTEGERNLALALSLPIGMTEYIPIGYAFSKLKRFGKGAASEKQVNEYMRYLTSAFQTGGQEGLQEAGAGMLQDMVEKGIYNPDAVIGESWASEFGYGAGAGAIFDVMLNVATRKSRNHDAAVERGDPDPENELIEPLSAEAADEVAKEHGLDVPIEHESEIDAFNAGQEIPIRPDISTPETTVPLPEIDTADAVIPPEVQAGDTLDIFDIKGTPIAAKVSAISDAGTIKIITPDGNEEILDNSFYMTRNVKNPDYLLVAPNLPSRVQGRTIKDLSDEELPTVLSELEERLTIFNSENVNPQSGAYMAVLSDYNAAKHEVERRKQLGIDVLGETLKAFDDGEEKAVAFEAEKLAEVAEGTTTLEDADQATRAEAERQLSLDFEETQVEEDTPIEVEETTAAEEIITPEAVVEEDVVEVEPKPKAKAIRQFKPTATYDPEVGHYYYKGYIIRRPEGRSIEEGRGTWNIAHVSTGEPFDAGNSLANAKFMVDDWYGGGINLVEGEDGTSRVGKNYCCC